jgi:hypothetical protein
MGLCKPAAPNACAAPITRTTSSGSP